MRQRLRSVKLCWTPSDMPVLNYAGCPELPPHKRSMLWVCSWMIYEIKEYPTCLSLWEVSSLQHCQSQPHNKANLNITRINPSLSLAPLQLSSALLSPPSHDMAYCSSYMSLQLFQKPAALSAKVRNPLKMAVSVGPGQICSVSLLFPCQVYEQMAFFCLQYHLCCIFRLGTNTIFIKKIFSFQIQYLTTSAFSQFYPSCLNSQICYT